jgi:hypothetical protein
MSENVNHVGTFCLLHCDERNEDFEIALVDKGRLGRNVATSGLFVNPFDSPFEDFDEISFGSTVFPVDSIENPGSGDIGGSLISIPSGSLLAWQDKSFSIEFWMNPRALANSDRRMPLAFSGGTSEEEDWGVEIFKPYGETNYELRFSWTDINTFHKYASWTVDVDLIKLNQWQHFVIQYDAGISFFNWWLDGVSQGPLEKPTTPNTGPWSGVNIIQTLDSSNNLTIGNYCPGKRLKESTTEFPSVYRGSIAEFRLISSLAPFPIAGDFVPPTEPYVNEEREPDPEPPEEVVINRAFVNGLDKLYIENARHLPSLCTVKTQMPQRAPELGNAAGELYFFRPDPQQNIIFMYVYVNTNGEGEEPVMRWMPVSTPIKGRENLITGTHWRNRAGNRLGEPF